MKYVDILLATYNGAKYIKQQLLSIIAQDYPYWKLIIHDDGSSDDTLQIVKEYCAKDDRIILIEDGIKFCSPGKNFMYLLKYATKECIFFCDQDDIWFENKISEMIKYYKDDEVPYALISSGYIFCTPKNKILGEINYKILNIRELLFVNGGIHGSRAMINRKMRDEMLNYYGPLNMHDHLMSQIACSFGKIAYLDIPLYLYRQHTNNVTGNIVSNPIKRLMRGFSKLKNKYLISKEIYTCNFTFYHVYESKLDSNDRKYFSIYCDVLKHNHFWCLYQILRNGFSIGHNGRLHLFFKTATRKLLE